MSKQHPLNVALARQNIRQGRYDNDEVLDETVDRLLTAIEVEPDDEELERWDGMS